MLEYKQDSDVFLCFKNVNPWQHYQFKKANMISNETTLMLKYSNRILEVIDNQEHLTRGDLQGSIEAIVLTILRERK